VEAEGVGGVMTSAVALEPEEEDCTRRLRVACGSSGNLL
jgi:hypothetical protein